MEDTGRPLAMLPITSCIVGWGPRLPGSFFCYAPTPREKKSRACALASAVSALVAWAVSAGGWPMGPIWWPANGSPTVRRTAKHDGKAARHEVAKSRSRGARRQK